MQWFAIKKTFFDFWDNMFLFIILNLGFLAVLAFPILLPYALLEVSSALATLALILGVLLFYVYAGAASLVTRDVTDYRSAQFRDFLRYLRETWPTSLLLGGITLLHILVLMVALPVYSAMGGFLGLLALVFLFWASVIWIFSSLYYFPVRARLDRKPGKILRKCFILFFDNTGFTITLFLGTVFILLASGFTAFLLPGLGAILLWQNVGLKLRLYKYDYLEEHPEANRRQIPWDVLLLDDRERVGKRSLRGMIFPWKE